MANSVLAHRSIVIACSVVRADLANPLLAVSLSSNDIVIGLRCRSVRTVPHIGSPAARAAAF